MTDIVADNDNHRPSLDGDHPFKTTTKFQRDEHGKLLRDAEGFLVPVIMPKDEIVAKRKPTREDRAAARARIASQLKGQVTAMARVRRPITKRQDIGDPACHANDNEDFPLLAVLRRDKLDHLIKTTMEYRRLVALCEAEPLKGQSYGNAMGMATEFRNKRLDGVAEVDAAAADGFKGKFVPGGEIEYTRQHKKKRGTYSVQARQKLAVEIGDTGEPNTGRTESLHVKLTDEVLVDYIDKKPLLAELRWALGPLREPFEDAVLGGRTFAQIGQKEGFSGRSTFDAGRALVFRAFSGLEGAWHDIAVRERKMERAAAQAWLAQAA